MGKVSVHGLLASFLAFGPSRERAPYSEWEATWPTIEILRECMPIMWPSTVRNQQVSSVSSRPSSFGALPRGIDGVSLSSGRLEKHPGTLSIQEKNLARDWKVVSCALSTAKYNDFLYYWLIVNTRSFYYELPSKGKTQTRADRMALCPFVDYFNHADHGVSRSNVFQDQFLEGTKGASAEIFG